MQLLLLREAEEELAAAARWYEQKRAGLGVEFMAALDRTFDQIRDAPLSFPCWHEDRPFRRCVVRRFPYVVIFQSSEQVVQVVAVAHGRRKPGYGCDRSTDEE